MQIVLTLVKIEELPTGQKDPCSYFDAVSLRADAWTSAFGRRLDLLGVERQAWQWINWKNLAGGAAELGKKHGIFCTKNSIALFYANAELDYSTAPNPYVGMLAYVNAFRAYAPTTTKLAYNGFSWARSSDGKLLHDEALIKKFDVWCPMNYGTSRSVIEKYWDEKNYKYLKTGTAIYPMVGVGRIDKDGDVWGFWSDSANHKGLKSLLRSSPLSGLCFYFGNGAKGHMFSGHAQHPALVDVIEEIRVIKG